MSETSTGEVLIGRDGAVARIRLNRPRAIHALTRAMCEAMAAALLAWRAEDGVRLVMREHAPAADGDPKLSRGFCAGGDIRAIAESAATDGAEARAFFDAEYKLNHLLFTYVKPSVAFMDGITMGGGVGIALPCRYRVATERTVFAMPETGIGLFPDVGGGWYLSRLPGRIGAWLATTGARIDGADALGIGFATHYLPSEALAAAKRAILADPADVEAILDAHAVAPPPSRLAAQRGDIDRLFAADVYEDILEALAADGGDWAQAQRETLAAKSPQTIKVALRQLREGARMTDFADEMRMEYAIATHVIQRPDFVEGVRALIVDKDNDPRWDPATPEAVTEHMLDTIFTPLPDAEAWEPVRF